MVFLLAGCDEVDIPETDTVPPQAGLRVSIEDTSWDSGVGHDAISVTATAGEVYSVIASANDSGGVARLTISKIGGNFEDDSASDMRGNPGAPRDRLISIANLEPLTEGQTVTLWATAEDYHGNLAETGHVSISVPGASEPEPPRSGYIPVTLERQGNTYIYSGSSANPTLYYSGRPHAVITSVHNPSYHHEFKLSHRDRTGTEVRAVMMGTSTTELLFNGLEVEGSWTAERIGDVREGPLFLTFQVRWELP